MINAAQPGADSSFARIAASDMILATGFSNWATIARDIGK
jgi:hypothetical protein